MSKNVLVSQDLSCFGQVSLLTALPLLSASGLNVSALPTALLSTHTGGFGHNTYLDLSQEMVAIINHWEDLNLKFSGIYLGYLGHQPIKQLTKHLARLTTAQALVLLDPVMGDNGHLYQGFDRSYVTAMQMLVPQAQVLTPNLTEAAFLLEQPELLSGGLSAAQFASQELQQRFNIPLVLITGVPVNNKQIAVVGWQANEGSWTETRQRSSASYFGTGDILAAALFAGLMQGVTPQTACSIAMDLISSTITERQADTNIDPRIGVNYSHSLPLFLKHLTQEGQSHERK